MKTDARVRYTRMVIRQNFLRLLHEKSVSKITVKEICERSEINRATFYKHYQDPFDLLEKIEEEMLSHLQNTLTQRDYQNIKALYTDVLTQLRENREQYESICSSNGDVSFSGRIFLTCYNQAFPLVASHFSNLSVTQQNMLYYFISQGCGGSIQYWMENGMQEPPEEIASFVEEMIFAITSYCKEKMETPTYFLI